MSAADEGSYRARGERIQSFGLGHHAWRPGRGQAKSDGGAVAFNAVDEYAPPVSQREAADTGQAHAMPALSSLVLK